MVAELDNGKGKCWTTETGQVINSFDLTIADSHITGASKGTGDNLVDLTDNLNDYTIAITEIDGGYSFYSSSKSWYVATTDNATAGSMTTVAATEDGASSTIGATSITVNDGTVTINNAHFGYDKLFLYNSKSNIRKFNYFPDSAQNADHKPVCLYEWRE